MIGDVGNFAIMAMGGVFCVLVGYGKIRVRQTDMESANFIRLYGTFFKVGGVIMAIGGATLMLWSAFGSK